MSKELTDLEIDEISLVDKPANPRAKVSIFKRDDGGNNDLVSKCLNGIQRENLSGISKADIEGALDSLAQEHAAKTGENFYQSYTQVLLSSEGAQLYNGLEALRATRYQNGGSA